MKKQVSVLAILAMLSVVGSAQAFDWFGGRLSIGGAYGRAKPELPYKYKDAYQDGEAWSVNAKYFINNDVSVVLSYADLEPYARGNRQDFYRFRPIVGSVRYNIFHHLPITPYITAGAGYSTNKREAPGTIAQKWSDLTLQGGVGFEFFLTEGMSIGAEALYHDFVRPGSVPLGVASLMGTANIYFGPGPSAKRDREEADKQKAESERASAEANAAKAAALAAQQQTLQAQQAAAQAQQGQQAAQAQVMQATTTAANAQEEAAAAKAKLEQMQNQSHQAQAELNAIKDMISRKDLNPIEFKTGSADLLVTSNATLDKVASVIKKYPDLKMRVEGHTDNVGAEEYNQQLSQKRADAVKNYLTGQGGLSSSQVTSVGMGKGGPIADNGSSAGRAKNRRVEFLTYIQ